MNQSSLSGKGRQRCSLVRCTWSQTLAIYPYYSPPSNSEKQNKTKSEQRNLIIHVEFVAALPLVKFTPISIYFRLNYFFLKALRYMQVKSGQDFLSIPFSLIKVMLKTCYLLRRRLFIYKQTWRQACWKPEVSCQLRYGTLKTWTFRWPSLAFWRATQKSVHWIPRFEERLSLLFSCFSLKILKAQRTSLP